MLDVAGHVRVVLPLLEVVLEELNVQMLLLDDELPLEGSGLHAAALVVERLEVAQEAAQMRLQALVGGVRRLHVRPAELVRVEGLEGREGDKAVLLLRHEAHALGRERPDDALLPLLRDNDVVAWRTQVERPPPLLLVIQRIAGVRGALRHGLPRSLPPGALAGANAAEETLGALLRGALPPITGVARVARPAEPSAEQERHLASSS
mmetsp:Transcript_19803/g.75918  ORF Transcript_19803/g.75918 Transcript_19803/m.75918 type:complete len:207 (-) Transcript_19803:1021-1641(-)